MQSSFHHLTEVLEFIEISRHFISSCSVSEFEYLLLATPIVVIVVEVVGGFCWILLATPIVVGSSGELNTSKAKLRGANYPREKPKARWFS